MRVFALIGLCAALAVPAEGQHGTSPYWSAAVVLPDAGGSEGGVVGNNIAVNTHGHVYVVSNVLAGHGLELVWYRSTDDGATWELLEPFAPGSFAIAGTTAFGPDDRLHFAYTDREPEYGVYYVYSDDGAQNWSAPVRISTPPVRTGVLSSPYISVDRRSRVHVAWHDGNPETDTTVAEVYYARSADGGVTWEPARLLSKDDGRHSAWPRFNVQETGSDTLMIPWRDARRPGDWDVFAAFSTDGGRTWTEQLAAGGPGAQWDPESLVAPDGTVHLGVMEYPEGGGDIRLFYTSTRNAGGRWTPPVQVSERRSRFPHLHYDAAGDVLWYLFKDERDAVGDEATYADVAGRYSLDGGRTWSTLEFATDEGDVEMGFQGYTVGPDGTFHINYEMFEAGPGQKHLRYIRRRAVATTVDVEVEPLMEDVVGAASPNPASTHVTWPVQGRPAGASGHATVYDLLGRVVAREAVAGTTLRLETAGLAPGVYLCRIELGDRVAYRHFVVAPE